MNGYEKLIKTIRQEGKRNQKPYPIRKAVMTAETKCSFGSQELEEEDLMVAHHLKGNLVKGDTVLITKISEECYVILEKVVEM